jgi:tyrosinase
MVRLSRRGLLAGTASLLMPHAALAQINPVRQSISGAGFRTQTLVSFATAIKAMLALPPSNPHNWYRLAMIHVLDCPHGSWWFLPWHRGYLAMFESLVRKYSGDQDFAMPYWDWTALPQLPVSMFDGVLTPTAPEFLENRQAFVDGFGPHVIGWFDALDAGRKASLLERFGIDQGAQIVNMVAGSLPNSRDNARDLTVAAPGLDLNTQEEVKIDKLKLAIKPDSPLEYSFPEFASSDSATHHEPGIKGPLETGPHDNVHGAIGGAMGRFMSPVDPIFCMHHGNLDRIWEVWTRRQQALNNPPLPALTTWQNEPFLFFVDVDGKVQDKKTSDFATLVNGVSYEAGSAEDLASPVQIVAPVVQSLSFEVAGLVPTNFRTFRELGAKITLPTDSLLAAREPFESRTDSQMRVAGNLAAEVTVIAPSDPENTRVMVFVNCPYLSRHTPASDPHYVGTIAFFGVGHSHHHSKDKALTYVLPLANAIKRIASTEFPIVKQLKLQFMAIDKEGSVKELDGSLVNVKITAT